MQVEIANNVGGGGSGGADVLIDAGGGTQSQSSGSTDGVEKKKKVVRKQKSFDDLPLGIKAKLKECYELEMEKQKHMAQQRQLRNALRTRLSDIPPVDSKLHDISDPSWIGKFRYVPAISDTPSRESKSCTLKFVEQTLKDFSFQVSSGRVPKEMQEFVQRYMSFLRKQTHHRELSKVKKPHTLNTQGYYVFQKKPPVRKRKRDTQSKGHGKKSRQQ